MYRDSNKNASSLVGESLLIGSSFDTIPKKSLRVGVFSITLSAMSEILDHIVRRRARRSVASRAVPTETLERVVSAAHLAPSCSNNQAWRFIVVTDTDARRRVSAELSGGNYWGVDAPAYIVVLASLDGDCRLDDGREYALFDAGIAVGLLLIQAEAEGLIAHPVAGFKPVELKAALGVPDEYVAITVIIVGFPGSGTGLTEKHRALEASPRVRRPLSSVRFPDRWRRDDS